MITVISGTHVQDFTDFRRGESADESFHANIPRVEIWIDDIVTSALKANRIIPDTVGESIFNSHTIGLVKMMIQHDPQMRPTTETLQKDPKRHEFSAFHPFPCCRMPPEKYIAHKDVNEHSGCVKAEPSNVPENIAKLQLQEEPTSLELLKENGTRS
jgi:hypothetical protein